ATAEASEIATAEPAAAIPVPEPESAYETPSEQLQRWFGRLRTGLSRSSTRLNEGINTIFLRRRLDSVALAELEDLLIASDMGTGVAGEVVEALRRSRFDQEIAPDEVRAALADDVIRLVEPVQKPLRIDPARRPFLILVVGVNGSGKTTTIGKLAKQYRDAGKSVILAAGDTFRAAAVEQLQIWGERADAPVMTRPTGSDAAGLAYDAFERPRQDGAENPPRRLGARGSAPTARAGGGPYTPGPLVGSGGEQLLVQGARPSAPMEKPDRPPGSRPSRRAALPGSPAPPRRLRRAAARGR